jgi:hypothetical protein
MMINKWASAFRTSGLSSLSSDVQKIVDDPATVEDPHKSCPWRPTRFLDGGKTRNLGGTLEKTNDAQ